MKTYILPLLLTLTLATNCQYLIAQQLDTAKETTAIKQLVKNYEDAWKPARREGTGSEL